MAVSFKKEKQGEFIIEILNITAICCFSFSALTLTFYFVLHLVNLCINVGSKASYYYQVVFSFQILLILNIPLYLYYKIQVLHNQMG